MLVFAHVIFSLYLSGWPPYLLWISLSNLAVNSSSTILSHLHDYSLYHGFLSQALFMSLIDCVLSGVIIIIIEVYVEFV
jgi:hypothetical protein